MAKKRGHGEGTVFERKDRPGTFRAMFTYSDPSTGHSHRKAFDGKSRKEALAAGRKWLEQIEDGLLPEANKITLWQWLERWLTDYVKTKVRVKSFDKYDGCLRCYIKPYLGDVLMVKLKSPDVQRLFNKLLIEGGRERKTKLPDGTEKTERRGISTSTVKATRRYLSMALDQAVKVGLLTKNVVKDTEPPKLMKKEIRPLSQEEATSLISEAKNAGETQYIAILLAVFSGMRLGENFGLMWDCVDLDRGTIHVRRSLITGRTGYNGEIFQEPKTPKSRRQIPLPPDVTKELRSYKKRQEWQIRITGGKYEDSNLVLTNQFGRPVDTSNFTTRWFKDLLTKSGIDRSVKFHDLRHTHATLLLQAGVHPKVVQERLGHSTISMTLDTYSHMMPDMQQTAVAAMEGMLTK